MPWSLLVLHASRHKPRHAPDSPHVREVALANLDALRREAHGCLTSCIRSQGTGPSTVAAKVWTSKAVLLNRPSDRALSPAAYIGLKRRNGTHTKSAHCGLSRVGTYAGSAVSFPGQEARLPTKRS